MDTFAQDLGFFGIIKKSFNILCSQRKTFLHISLALLLPLGIASQIASILYPVAISDDSSSTVAVIAAVFIVIAAISSFVLGLLSIAAITTAATQAILEVPLHFPSIIKRTPRILKKLFVTFLWCFLFAFLYYLVLAVLVVLVIVFLRESNLGFWILVVLGIVYLIGSLYISIVFSVANVVSVLEEVYGRAAIVKSKNLLRGKEVVAGLILIVVGLVAGGVQFGLAVAAAGDPNNVLVRVLVGVASCVVVVVVTLLVQVIYTVLYFVCKFRHSEAIDGSLLASHLDAYLGNYVALQSEESNV